LIPEVYAEAREHFLEAAEKAGFRTMRYRISNEESPELFQDYALLRRDPKKVLVQISGVHGVEGYLGSAIQRKILARDFSPEGPSLLFIHALNPYGMAFYRRANAENVDLNRNFRSGPARPNPDYDHFNSYLNPRSRFEFFTGLAKGFYHKKRLGPARTNQAVAAGQVKFPRGLFYMGDRVQREVYLLQEFLRAHCTEAEVATVIDLHSGLGAFGSELLFVDQDSEPSAPEYLSTLFGRPVSSADPKQGFYKNQGPLSDAIRQALPKTKLYYVLQEFGAHSAGFTLNALREENFEWHLRPKGGERLPKIRDAMLEAFFPRDPKWRENAITLGELRWSQAEAASTFV
jgi:hypothetical protein